MLGDQVFGRLLPLGCVLPTVVPFVSFIDSLRTPPRSCHTHRCLFRQLPCLYAFPQCSHLSSPAAAFSFLVRRVPSLALRILFFVLSTPWKDDRAGPSTTALPPSLSGSEVWCGRLLGKDGRAPPSFRVANAAFDIELRLLTAVDPPSATACSTAELSKAGFAEGEKVELFRRLIRFVPPSDPDDTVWECERLYEFRNGRLVALEPTDMRCWLVGRDMFCGRH